MAVLAVAPGICPPLFANGGSNAGASSSGVGDCEMGQRRGSFRKPGLCQGEVWAVFYATQYLTKYLWWGKEGQMEWKSIKEKI